jgi:hypothetical protein
MLPFLESAGWFILWAILAVNVAAMNTQSVNKPPSNNQATTTYAHASSATPVALNATVLSCFVKLPNNPLSAEGLATPIELQPPCAMNVSTQQAFAEAAIFDTATSSISIYHPLIISAGQTPATPPVVPNLTSTSIVGLWFGLNGNVLQLLDQNGQDTNQSPQLEGIDCVNGLPGVQGDVFGQVSWCNTIPFFTAANEAIVAGNLVVPPIGTDSIGNPCPTSRSFELVDACPSDNVPTQYLLLSNGGTVQDTAANRANYPNAMIINNASDEALLSNILDPLIGCTSFSNPSIDNPGENVPSLAGSELQASVHQQAPVALVPINDPDCLLTSNASLSTQKTNAYRLGVNQGLLGNNVDTNIGNNGALVPYCDGMVSIAPSFFKGFETLFSGTTTPDACVGNNLFTFLCNRYLMSLKQLTCPANTTATQPVTCATNPNTGAATSCVINLSSTVVAASATAATTAATIGT